MRLETAIHTSAQGLTAAGQGIAVTSDNIANNNTTGFKEARAEFSDIMVEGLDGYRSSAEPASGSGVVVSNVRTIFANGELEITNRQLDVGIDGGGFFIVGDPNAPAYTRDGAFSIDVDGFLVNKNGQQVLGYAAGSTTLAPIDMTNVSLVGAQTTTASMTGNLDATATAGTVPTTPPTSFKDIAKNANFISNLTAYDSLGDKHDFTMAFTKTANNAWTVQAYIDGGDVGGTAGAPVQVGTNLAMTFTENGVNANPTASSLTLSPAYSNGAASGNFTVDLSGFSQFAASSDLKSFNQDGKASGNLEGYEFTKQGEVQAVLSSGARQTLATIQLADFVSEDGLERSGSSIFTAGVEAGERTVDAPGTGALGSLRGGALERSTVDLSNQFVGLVVLQRAYQANSKALESANQTLRDTIGLMR